MLTLDSTLRDLLQHIPSYQPLSIGDFYKPGWWVRHPQDEQLKYIQDLGLSGIDFRGKSFMDIGCAEGYACFYAEISRLKSRLAAFEQGRFIRFMRALHHLGNKAKR